MRYFSGHPWSLFSSSGHGRPQARRSCTSVRCSPWVEAGRAVRRVCPLRRWHWTWWTTGATSCPTTSWSSSTTTAWWVHVEERQRRCALYVMCGVSQSGMRWSASQITRGACCIISDCAEHRLSSLLCLLVMLSLQSITFFWLYKD